MAFSTDLELVGVRETIRALNKVEPGLRKQFVAEARTIAQPAIDKVRSEYVKVPLSGMKYNWSDKTGRKLFPFSLAKARSGVQLKVDTDRRATAIISIIQRNQAAAIFETAGRKNPNLLEKSLGDLRPWRTRILGPAVYRSRRAIEGNMSAAIHRAMRRVQKELN